MRRKEITDGNAIKNWWWMIPLAVLCVLTVWVQTAPAATIHYPLDLRGADWTAVEYEIRWDSVGTWVVDATGTVTPKDTSFNLLNTRDYVVILTYKSPSDTVTVEEPILYRGGSSDSTAFPIVCRHPDWTQLTIGTAYRSDSVYVDGAVHTFTLPVDTTIWLSTAYDWMLTWAWVEGAEFALGAMDLQYATNRLPAPATTPLVRLYYDVSTGAVSGEALAPMTGMWFTLNLVTHGAVGFSDWGIVPRTQRARPVNGRVIFDVPATTAMTPAGAYYELRYDGWLGYSYMEGLIKRFYVDTLPNPLNILDAEDAWRGGN